MNGNYPHRYRHLLDEADGPILDIGCGGHHDPRVTGIDIEPGPHASYGDALDLQFPDDHFALTISQAVLEHVTEPHTAVAEMIRVTRPGGRVYIEVAFLQPEHSAPHHYFNVAPEGLRYLCRDLEIEAEGVVGTTEEAINWIAADAGLSLRIPLNQSRYKRQKPNVAMGLIMLARKPEATS